MEEMLMALTGKKRAFADAVLAGLSNREAAIRAGYSAATASAAGSRLVKDQEVAAHLASARSHDVNSSKRTLNGGPSVPAAPPTPTFDINAALMHADPKAFLTVAMNDPALDAKLRIDAAKALMPFSHPKLGEGGKKDQKQDAAKAAAQGRFGAPPAPPRLISNNAK